MQPRTGPAPRLDELPPLPDDVLVSVVMPVRNEAGFIERSLAAVLLQDEPGARVEVILCDGDSDDGTPELARRLTDRLRAEGRAVPDVTILHNEHRIVPVSLNRALAVASGDLVIRVDGHCEIAPDYVRQCVAQSRTTGAACVGGPIRTVGADPLARAIAAAQSSRFGVGGVAFRTSDAAGPVDTLAFGAYRREVFDAVGDFDESLVRNQDDEFNLRVTRAGGVIWMDPTIRSTYHARGTYSSLWRQYHGYGFYKVRVMRKHRTVPAPRHLVPAAFVVATLGALLIGLVARRWWPAALVLGPYVALDMATARATARDAGVPAGQVAAATTVMHVAYGLGTLAGAVDLAKRRGQLPGTHP